MYVPFGPFPRVTVAAVTVTTNAEFCCRMAAVLVGHQSYPAFWSSLSRLSLQSPANRFMAADNLVKKLLIVDDSTVEQTSLIRLLQEQWPNYEINEAADGEAELSAVEQWMPDLVLTDLCLAHLSDMNSLVRLRDK